MKIDKLKFRIFFLIVFLLNFFALTRDLKAATYHVATAGNDSNGGTSLSDALATPKAGVAKLIAGDTLVIHEGTYTGTGVQNITFPISGTAVDMITVTSSPDEDMPILDAGVAHDADCESNRISVFLIDGRSFITLDHLDIRNACGHTRGNVTIGADSASDHINVQYCKVGSVSRGGATWTTNNPAQIWVGQSGGTHDVVINNCEIYGDAVGEGSGIKIQNVSNIKIENNEFHHLGSGIANKYGNATSTGHVYASNLIHDCGSVERGGIWCGSPGAVITNNLIINSQQGTINLLEYGAGIEMAQSESYDFGTQPVITHNTIYNTNAGIWFHAANGDVMQYSVQNAMVKNNVVVNAHGTAGAEYSINKYAASEQLPNESDHNVFYSSSSSNVVDGGPTGGGYSLTLNQWRTKGFDNFSFNAMPTFANASGNLNQISDFEIMQLQKALTWAQTYP